jgi:hypothetical protein
LQLLVDVNDFNLKEQKYKHTKEKHKPYVLISRKKSGREINAEEHCVASVVMSRRQNTGQNHKERHFMNSRNLANANIQERNQK